MKGRGVKAVEDQPGKHGKPLEDADGRDRGAGRRARPLRGRGAAGGRHAARVRDAGRRAADLRARRRGRDPQGLRRVDRRAGRTSAATSSRSTARCPTPRTPRTSARRTRTATSRCSSPSSSSWRPASGMQVRGWTPFVSTFAAFLSRAYDFVRMGAISQAKLVLSGSHAGVSIGEDGPSQMALEDIASLRAIHGSTVAAPERRAADGASSWPRWPTATASRSSARCAARRPCAPRRTRTCASAGRASPTRATTWPSSPAASRSTRPSRPPSGSPTAACKARVLDAYSIKPIDAEAVRAAARDCGAIVTVEDHAPEGGLGDAVLEALAEGDEQRARRQARGPRDPRLRHARGAPARREDRRRRDRRRGPEARRLARLTRASATRPPEPGRGAAELRDAAELHDPVGLPGGAVVVGEELLPAGGVRRDVRPARSACGAGRLRGRRRPRTWRCRRRGSDPRRAGPAGPAAAWRTTRCATCPSRASTGAG